MSDRIENACHRIFIRGDFAMSHRYATHRTSRYTGRNPTAPKGLFPVLVTRNGYSGICTSDGLGGADHPLPRNVGWNMGGNVGCSGMLFRGSMDVPSFLSSRSRAGLFLNRRLTWVAECFDREGAAWDRFDGRTVEPADPSKVGSERRRDISTNSIERMVRSG